MIVLVGGSGFVGTRLSDRLSRSGSEFYIVDKALSLSYPTISKQADVCSVEQLSDTIEPGAVIINLAAEHRDDVRPKSRYDDVNVQGARNICQAAREKGISKIIFTSSVAVYGFAPPNTGEDGEIAPFNDYGRTKYEAELIYREWQEEKPEERSLVIVRPTVVFGEGNRGNVYNLLRQIASGRFVMFGRGDNRKSMAYVENVAAFLEHCLTFGAGVHLYNYIDKPDFDMNTLVSETRKALFGKKGVGMRLPALLGMVIGYAADIVTGITGKTLPVSSIRVKKFLGSTQFDTSVSQTGFIAPVSLEEGLGRTLRYEFLEDNSQHPTYDTE